MFVPSVIISATLAATPPTIQAIVIAALLACGANPDNPDDPEIEPTDIPQAQETWWCCDSVSGQGNGSGEGCEPLASQHVALCPKVLHCTKGYTNNDGSVHCTDG